MMQLRGFRARERHLPQVFAACDKKTREVVAVKLVGVHAPAQVRARVRLRCAPARAHA
jgi:hypothetical protein